MMTAKDKIALFIPSLRGGGLERNMINLSRGFSDHGHQTDLVLARAEGQFLELVDPRVTVVDLQAKRVALALSPLTSYLRRERPQALLAGMGNANITALLAGRLAKGQTPVVVSNHNYMSMAAWESERFGDKVMPLLARLFYGWAQQVVAVSGGVAADLLKVTGLPANRITVIGNPVITPEFEASTKEPVSHPFLASTDTPVVLAVGRLVTAKSFDVLLQAFSRLNKTTPSRLIILGEGPERAALEALAVELGIADKVSLPGFVDNPWAYMKQAAVLAVSSRHEGFGNVLVEAMGCGTPVVATECPGGPAEILGHGEFGPLVPVDDATALGEALVAVLSEPPDGEKLRLRAQDFSCAAVAARYLEVLVPAQVRGNAP